MLKKLTALTLAGVLALSLTGCSVLGLFSGNTTVQEANTEVQIESAQSAASGSTQQSSSGDTVTTIANTTDGGALDTADLFSTRDLTQTPDLSEATYLTVESGEDITVTAAGVYVLSGAATEVTVVVEAGDEDKVQLVLDGVSITNADFPCIYVKNADKVFVTTAEGSDNTLAVTGTFTADGDTNTDAVIFSRDDLVLGGLGTLTVSSTDNGISGKDDLKITGGTLNITCVSDAIEANDSIRIAGGEITLSTRKDGLHAENDEDNTLGWIYICGGTLNITAGDDGIHGTTIVQIDDGTLNITAAEGIEGTWIQINGGVINISASDDGINGARKSTAYTVTVEFNGGETTIVMGQGDTDGVDSNGNIVINGGTIDVTGQSAFDYDGTATYNGGTVIVNGEETTTITNQFGGMGGGWGGQGGWGGGPGGGQGGGWGGRP